MAERTKRRRSFAFSRVRRRGYTLVFFAMMLFGIMAMAALVIDIGFARLTQRQMQTAVNAAALEGLRFRDQLPPGYLSDLDLDESRRQQASDIVAWTLDDNLNPNDGDPVNFGAGPRIDLRPGIDEAGTINAGQFISSPENPNPNPKIGSLPDPPVYKPTRSHTTTRGLELNLVDAIYGDMLAGEYVAENPSDPNDPDWHDEQPDYSRTDFNPTAATRDAFLVRMRRFHDDFDTVDTEAGVSSKGPEIPYLFGRGSLLPAADPSAGYSPRHHGVTVRATAIAGSRNALSIGFANNNIVPRMTGLATNCASEFSFALSVDYWKNPAGSPIISSGVILVASKTIGRFFAVSSDASEMPLVVGRELQVAASATDGFYTGYVPIYEADRVIGFGYAHAEVNGGSVTITQPDPVVAAENASAVICYATGLSAAGMTSVLNANRMLVKPLYAPASAR